METDIVPNNIIKILLIATAAIGLIEGLGWSTLSFIAIGYYSRIFTPSISVTYFQADIGRTIYDFYLNSRYESTLKTVMDSYFYPLRATSFCACMSISLFINMILVICSGGILWVLCYKKQTYIKHIIGCWVVTMAANIIYDIILFLLLIINYSSIKRFQSNHPSGPSASDSIVLASTGVVMTIASRGFILWVINVIFVGLMGKLWISYYKKIPFFSYERFNRSADTNSPWIEEPYQYSNSTVSIGRIDDSSSHFPYAKLKPLDYRPSSNNEMSRAVNMDIIQANNDRKNVSRPNPKPSKPLHPVTQYEEDPLDIPIPFIPPPDYSPLNSPVASKPVGRINYLL